jgi:DNA-binding PadR family transcriptional regulator
MDQMRKGTTVVAILKLLADTEKPLHAYEMIKRLEERSQGLFHFGEGLVYPTLHRMQREGLLESRWLHEPGTRRRKVYTVTDKGHNRLQIELHQWQEFARGMDLLLQIEPPSRTGA